MIVCNCRWVTERAIVEEIRGGATDVDAIRTGCGAGSDCGTCVDLIEDVLESSLTVHRISA